MAERKNSRSRSETKSDAATKSVITWKCESCNKEFKEEDSKLLECERCSAHYCIKCVKFSEREYEFLTERSDLHWFCVECDVKVVKCITQDKEIEQRCDDFFGKLNARMVVFEASVDKKLAELGPQMDAEVCKMKQDVAKQIGKLSDEVNTMKAVVDMQLNVNAKHIKELNTKMSELIEGQEQEDDDSRPVTFAEMVNKQVEKKMTAVQDEVREVQKTMIETREYAMEEKDKENRANNVILYKVPESTAESAETRNKDDCHFFIHLCNAISAGIMEEDVAKVFRLGRRSDTGTPRPLLVQLSSRMAKNLLMGSVFKLRHVEAKFRQVVVAHDMTHKERQECKELVEQAKEKNDQESGNWVYKVRGSPGQMRIVRYRKTP